MGSLWHHVLVFLRLRDDLEWAAPGLGPEVPHPYFQHERLRCCSHCGGGRLHAIHSRPWNERRTAEILAIENSAGSGR